MPIILVELVILVPETGVDPMQRGRLFGSAQSDATPWPWPIRRMEPAMAVCPVGTPMTPEAMQEIYRVAYERALAAARPTVYELASAASAN